MSKNTTCTAPSSLEEYAGRRLTTEMSNLEDLPDADRNREFGRMAGKAVNSWLTAPAGEPVRGLLDDLRRKAGSGRCGDLRKELAEIFANQWKTLGTKAA